MEIKISLIDKAQELDSVVQFVRTLTHFGDENFDLQHSKQLFDGVNEGKEVAFVLKDSSNLEFFINELGDLPLNLSYEEKGDEYKVLMEQANEFDRQGLLFNAIKKLEKAILLLEQSNQVDTDKYVNVTGFLKDLYEATFHFRDSLRVNRKMLKSLELQGKQESERFKEIVAHTEVLKSEGKKFSIRKPHGLSRLVAPHDKFKPKMTTLSYILDHANGVMIEYFNPSQKGFELKDITSDMSELKATLAFDHQSEYGVRSFPEVFLTFYKGEREPIGSLGIVNRVAIRWNMRFGTYNLIDEGRALKKWLNDKLSS